MAIRTVNKLVRDKMPEIITNKGEVPKFRVLNDKEFLEALNKKLMEEVKEYIDSGEIKELADILQIICSISEVIGGGKGELDYLREEKAAERGTFSAKIFLESIDDKKKS